MASDGVWDFMTPLEVVSFVAKHSYQKDGKRNNSNNNNNHNNSEDNIAKLLVDEVLTRAALDVHQSMTLDDIKQIPLGKRRSYHDDTSVIVVYLND